MKEENNAPETLSEAKAVLDYSRLSEDKVSEKSPINQDNWRNYQIRITDHFEKPQALISQGDKIVLSRGNIGTLIGKAKSFKSFVCSAIVSAVEDEFLTFRLDDSVKKILLIDTEQSSYHVANILNRIYRITGWDYTKPKDDSIIVLALRPLDTKQRLEKVREAISEIHPDLIIIDGIRDLLIDFNSIDESSNIVNLLMKISFELNCGILTVIHQNKNDRNARGHCGSELINKSETVLEVVNTDGIATVSAAFSRNPPIDDFSFRIVNGIPELCNAPKTTKKLDELRELMKKAMFGTSWIQRKDLVKKLEGLTGKTDRTCERKIKQAIDNKILGINGQGYLIMLNDYSNATDDEIPF